MTVRVRTKWTCSGKEGNTVFLHTVGPRTCSPRMRFTQATPWGEIRVTVDNPDAAIQFEPGKFYYAEFTPATEFGPPRRRLKNRVSRGD